MAAPADVSVHNIGGKWEANLKLSDDIKPAMELQGVSWIVRNMLAKAPISVALKQTADAGTGASRIDSTQTSLGRVAEETRVLDWEPRDQSHVVFGKLSIRGRFASPADVESVLRARSGSGESDWQGDVIEMQVEGSGWTSTQVWGFTDVGGCKRHTRRSVVRNGEKNKVVQLVYDWVSPNVE